MAPSMQLQLVVLSFSISLTHAVTLPSVSAKAHSAKNVDHWWAQVGDRVFYPPPASFLAMSQNVSDYYYVMGSKSALTDKMKEHVVGSEGRWHIMQLPKGPSMLEVSARSSNGDRRSSFSKFTQLKSGTVLKAGFPPYELKTDYKYPSDAQTQTLEKDAVSLITDDSAMDYLKLLVDGTPTRSYSNMAESAKVEGFLKKQFELLGIHTCYHTFDSGSSGSLTNVIGRVPGSDRHGGVIVGAHYDSRPFEGSAPGAEDNGSGVASLLAMAKAFMQKKVAPKKDVYFVAFAGEEPGLIGSKHFADALTSEALPADCSAPSSFIQKAQTKLNAKRKFQTADYRAIIMDEIGWASPKLDKKTVNLESYDTEGHEVMDHLRASSQMHNGDKIDVVHNAHPFGSDHMSFLDHGIAAALTINGDDEAYPNYHQSSDKIEGNVDPKIMAMITKMNLGGLIRMSMA